MTTKARRTRARRGRVVLEHPEPLARGALDWQAHASLVAQRVRGGRMLVVSISRPVSWLLWQIACVETLAPPGGGPVTEAVAEAMDRAVFDDHAHERLPAQRSLAAALALAERFATWWHGSRAKPFACRCETITKKHRGSPKNTRGGKR